MSVFELLSAKQKSWVQSKESLTKRLCTLFPDKIKHHLFYDNWGVAKKLFRDALQMDDASKTWIRTMQWRYENKIWMDCTVVIPEASIQQEKTLSEIQTRSIGEILFSDPTLTRSDFVFEQKNNGIARYSIFYYKNQPLLIDELFLTDFLNAMEQL